MASSNGRSSASAQARRPGHLGMTIAAELELGAGDVDSVDGPVGGQESRGFRPSRFRLRARARAG